MFNPLLFIEHPNHLLLLLQTCGVLMGRVVPFEDLHFQKEILILKGSTLYSLYKEGGWASREGMDKHNTIVKYVHELL